MLFAFLKYISPTWYFNLRPVVQPIPYFVDYRRLETKEQGLLDIDHSYLTEQGRIADAAYQAWQKGIMKKVPGVSLYTTGEFQKSREERIIELSEGHTVTVNDDIFVTDINDNYRFIRRFFNPAIAGYILVVRLLSFRNPLRELIGFINSQKVRRVDLYSKNSWQLLKADYESFDSPLIRQNPKVSVIIPTLNRYEYLKDVLSDLELQSYINFEVIVCDQSDPIHESFYNGWDLDIKLIRQKEKALWQARNSSINAATGEYIALSEDDVRINYDWLSQHLKCIDFFGADISAGVFYPEHTEIPVHKKFFRWSDQFATGNVLIKRDVFTKTGLFDRQFEKQRNGDGEYGLRCYLIGLKSISNPLAYCEDVKALTGGLRELGSWDSFRPTNLFSPRPVPSVLYLSRKYFGNHLSRLMLLFSVPGSVIPYKYKGEKWLKILSMASLFILWPLLLIQVLISWHRSSVKLTEGPKVDKLS